MSGLRWHALQLRACHALTHLCVTPPLPLMYHAALRVRPNYNEALNDLVHALQVPPP